MGQEQVARQNRRRLLNQIRTMWIEGVLEHSLHQAALMALDVQEQPDALAHPWHLESQETNQPPHPLPAGTSIVQVYEEAGGELLILGEPGVGKTTLLLELARTLLERAEADEHQPLPVIFHLSSWARTRSPLSDWLVEELRTTYQVPWIAAHQILPLLDGLDEVAEEARPGCEQAITAYVQRQRAVRLPPLWPGTASVQAITAYAQRQREQGAVPLVVCCRSQDYAALPTRVNLHQAVSIQPLTQDQIDGYLQSAKGQLEGLRQALHQDPELSELARRPLMLSILTLAYQGAGAEVLLTEETREAQQRQIFASYVERMLRGRRIAKHAPGEPMLRWLRFLAIQMQQHQQTVFFLEQLQPDWLADRRRRLLFQLSVGLVVGLVAGLLVVLQDGLRYGLSNGLAHGLVDGPIFVLFVGLVYGLDRRRRLLYRLSVGLIFGLIFGLVYGLVVGLIFGLIGGPIFGLVYGLVVGLFVGLLGGLLGGLVARLFTNQLDELPRLRPNQGIWRSARNGLVVGLLYGLVIGLVVGLDNGLRYGLLSGLLNGLVVGPLFGLFVGLFYGLGAFLQHFILRFWLWRAGSLPWNVVAFLDEAAERLLLRKVGGGYIFVHRLLLDYFASLEKKES